MVLDGRGAGPVDGSGPCPDRAVRVNGEWAIGQQVALQLAAVGVPTLNLIYPQEVEVVNLAPQGMLEEGLGRPKVQATAELCRRNPRPR
jgi:molybdopterin/thiamine biosynthesis adenylyltransferase